MSYDTAAGRGCVCVLHSRGYHLARAGTLDYYTRTDMS